MIYTVYPCPVFFCPPCIHFAPYHFALGNLLMIYTIYSCPVSFFPLDWTLGAGLLCLSRMLGQMLRCLQTCSGN